MNPHPEPPQLTIAAGFQRIKGVGPAVVVTFTGFKTDAEAKELADIMQNVGKDLVAAFARGADGAALNTPRGVLSVAASVEAPGPLAGLDTFDTFDIPEYTPSEK